jgi:hypothetical protein
VRRFHCIAEAKEKRKKDFSRNSCARLSQPPDQENLALTVRVVGGRAGSKDGQHRSNDEDPAPFWQDARHGKRESRVSMAGKRRGRRSSGDLKSCQRESLVAAYPQPPSA